MAKDNGDWKKYLIGAVIGGLLVHFTAFMLIYQDQPHDFNCNRAEEACNLQGNNNNGIDTTPYSDCDSCCPTPEQSPDCDGQLIPTGDQRSYSTAIAYCSQFTSCTSSVSVRACLPVYGIAGLWTSCACQSNV